MIDVPDQPLAERVLRAALAREHPPQQLLFFGPPGTGKRRAARATAWRLMDPDGSHAPEEEALDLSVVRGTGAVIRLEDELEPALADLASRPAVGRRRVMIVEGAERLREQDAAPRILKRLEEPPPRSHLILVTDRVADLLPTIRSRCLAVPFRSPGWRAIARQLTQRGLGQEEAAGLARAHGAAALGAGPFELRMRALGLDLAERALAGEAVGVGLVRSVQAAMEAAAAEHPSAELERLRGEAAALSGKRGERTAVKRVDDQAKRERRRAVSDGWAHVLDGAAGLVADALALAVGADAAVRHAGRVENLRAVAVPAAQPFLERALEEIELTRSELILNPTVDLAIEAMLERISAARAGAAGPLTAPGRLPF
ncbi:MAG: polymerase subunit delta [Miltoncostaeaceae bacterium]|nr:polymerase subunit delta [Miltoncostaeaceae bacterium]